MVRKRITRNPQEATNIFFVLNRQEQKAVYINQTIVSQTMETKSLEVVPDKSLTWDLRIKRVTKKIASAMEQLYWLISWKWKSEIIDKREIYVTMIKSIWPYGVHIPLVYSYKKQPEEN